MISLKKTIGLDHHVLEGPKSLADNTERLRTLGVKAITEKLYPNHANSSPDIPKSDTDSLVPIELTEDLRVSDLSMANHEGIRESGDDESIGHDETDNTQENNVGHLNPSGSPKVENDAKAVSSLHVGFDLPADEGNASIEYMPQSHLSTPRRSWFNLMCCGVAGRRRERKHRKPKVSAVRQSCRSIAQRFSQWFNRSAE